MRAKAALLVKMGSKMIKVSCLLRDIRRSALCLAAILSCAALAPRPTYTKGLLLDFEGTGNKIARQSFYDGGAAGNAAIGPDYDVTFAGRALALVDADDGGSANFANAPSSKSTMDWLNDVDTHMNFTAGFSQFSLYHSTPFCPGSLSFWTGPNRMGSQVGGTQFLAANRSGCGGDPSGASTCWTKVSVVLPQLAYSATSGGSANDITFDSVSFNPQGVSVPGPLPILGVATAFGASRRMTRRLQIGNPT